MKAVILSLSVVAVFWMWWKTNFGGFWCGQSQASVAQLFVNELIKTAFYHFNAGVRRYPTTEEGLSALLHAPIGTEQRWNGPYIEGGKIPLDPWGREYQYRSPALKSSVGYDIWSLGPDGIPSADDIGNWTK